MYYHGTRGARKFKSTRRGLDLISLEEVSDLLDIVGKMSKLNFLIKNAEYYYIDGIETPVLLHRRTLNSTLAIFRAGEMPDYNIRKLCYHSWEMCYFIDFLNEVR